MKGPQNQFLEYFTPYYSLDQFYNIRDWNYAFQYLFADWTDLEFGDSATKFVDVFENVAHVKSRNLTTFFIGSVPVIDREPIHIDHKDYGMMVIQKFAVQNFDETGKFKCWTLSYNIDRCEKLEEIHEKMISWFEYDTLYTRFVTCLNQLASHHKAYASEIAALLSAKPSLCIGGFGSEELYKSAAKSGVKDSLENRRCTQHWNEQYIGEHGNRTCIERLNGFGKESREQIVAPLLYWTAEDPARCIKEMDRVLTKDGKAYILDLERVLAPSKFAGADKDLLSSYSECFEFLSQRRPSSELKILVESKNRIEVIS